MSLVSSRVRAADAAFTAVKDFYFTSRYAERRFAPGVCDFTFGNPHEMPLDGIVGALRDKITPHDKNWFAYKTSEQDAQEFLADTTRKELGLAFEPADFALTTGAFTAIMVASSKGSRDPRKVETACSMRARMSAALETAPDVSTASRRSGPNISPVSLSASTQPSV